MIHIKKGSLLFQKNRVGNKAGILDLVNSRNTLSLEPRELVRDWQDNLRDMQRLVKPKRK